MLNCTVRSGSQMTSDGSTWPGSPPTILRIRSVVSSAPLSSATSGNLTLQSCVSSTSRKKASWRSIPPAEMQMTRQLRDTNCRYSLAIMPSSVHAVPSKSPVMENTMDQDPVSTSCADSRPNCESARKSGNFDSSGRPAMAATGRTTGAAPRPGGDIYACAVRHGSDGALRVAGWAVEPHAISKHASRSRPKRHRRVDATVARPLNRPAVQFAATPMIRARLFPFPD
mmetsp:Transcript_20261/g.71633  ORF Transcript_20261/g.71633 Transcript_20261/m.71633 type:complete len:227 (-) Transcript_20261:54-734(-)